MSKPSSGEATHATPRYAYLVLDASNWPYPVTGARGDARKLRRELQSGYGDLDGPFRIKRYKLDRRFRG